MYSPKGATKSSKKSKAKSKTQKTKKKSVVRAAKSNRY